ncbi:MAG: SpoIID/LytB domain-containing protein [Nitrospirae bacterium]|nr:MAG: SpoIID/LytB domain-containing protein [Nitrospirota bacterium]
MKKRAFFLISLLTILFVPVFAFGQNIRVLILDKRFPLLPDNDTALKQIGNIKGELLLRGINYRGRIEVWKGKKGLYVINELPLEEYVKSVVYSETTDDWQYEALKVQAVIVRTYAVRQIMKNRDSLYHLSSSTLHQIYRGNHRDELIEKAVDDTRGLILTYKGEPIEALYHSTCGGMTEYAEEVFSKSLPYLKPVKNDCSISPYWRWRKRIDKREIERALKLENILDLEIAGFTKSGRVKTVRVITENNPIVISAKDLRRSLGWKRLPSTWFDLTRKGETFVFDGRGYGHGVGLCQWGALEMAQKGKNFRYILSYYYPGTRLERYHED